MSKRKLIPKILKLTDEEMAIVNDSELSNVDSLRLLVDQGYSINSRGILGWTMLHVAAATLDLDAVVHLLDSPEVMPLSETYRRETALYVACVNNRPLDMVELILRRVPALLNRATTTGDSPLHCACRYRRRDLTQLFLSAGAQLDLKDYRGETPLHKATRQSDNHTVVSMMLHAGADANVQNVKGQSPFLIAAGWGDMETLAEIAPFVSDIDHATDVGNTALHLAVSRKFTEMVAFLLEEGADPNLFNDDSMLPLDLALTNKDPVNFPLLLEATRLDVIDPSIFISACTAQPVSIGIVKCLIESDLPPSFFNEYDRVPDNPVNFLVDHPEYKIVSPLCYFLHTAEYLYYASPEMCLNLLHLFLSHGAPVNPVHEMEFPALAYYAFGVNDNSCSDVVDVLIRYGLNVELSVRNRFLPCAFTNAIRYGKTRLIMSLLKYTIKVDPEDIIDDIIYANIMVPIYYTLLERILPMCSLTVGQMNEVRRMFQYYYIRPFETQLSQERFNRMLTNRVGSLQHFSKKSIRGWIRSKVGDTPGFMRVLKMLNVPPHLEPYLRNCE